MYEIFNLKYNAADINLKRTQVSRLLKETSSNIKSTDIKVMSTADLLLLFQIYNRIFLDDWFGKNYRGKFKFSLSRRLTRSAGLTRYPRSKAGLKTEQMTIEITIGVDFFLQYNMVEGNKAVGGITTANSLEALQLVFEHELCHAIEYICYGTSSCSGDRFKRIAANLFGHTGKFHSLPTNRQIASQKMGFNLGDSVSFSFKGRRLKGILYRINKRAVVMVKDKKGRFADKQGNRYSKYYVPLHSLEK